MQANRISVTDRKCAVYAEDMAKKKKCHCAAIELPDGNLCYGKTGKLFGCSSAMLLNALKTVAGIPDEEQIISPEAIEPIQKLKVEYLGSKNPNLHIDEMLIALSMSAATSENAKKAMEALPKLKGCEVHTTVLLTRGDEKMFRKIGVNLTCVPVVDSH